MKDSNIWDYTKTLLYNAETNCHPFNVVNDKYNCPLTQGEEYLKNVSNQKSTELRNSIPIGCKLQISLATDTALKANPKIIYFNSGVSVGTAGLYRKLFQKAVQSTLELPSLCLEDQGILGWLYASKELPISLDFNSELLSTTQIDRLKYFDFNQTSGTWQNTNGASPFIIHFAGSKRAYKAYWKQLRLWNIEKLTSKVFQKKLKNSFIDINGQPTSFYSVCPEEKFSLWKSTSLILDSILKSIGLSPHHSIPEEYIIWKRTQNPMIFD